MVISLIEQSEYVSDGLWRWSVFLASESPLQDIKEVVYTLHPSFSRPVRRVQTRQDSFRIEDTSSRPFTIYAKVAFADGSEQLLEKRLELTQESSAQNEIITQPPRPVIVVVEDDVQVIAALVRDLRSRYRPL